jgi:hypothetical protein
MNALMNALKILKQVSANKIPTFYTTQEFVTYVNEVNEAIAELEDLELNYNRQVNSAKLQSSELQEQKTCNKCIYAIHCEETDEYSYNHKDQNCKDCYRSGWTDNYNTGEQK